MEIIYKDAKNLSYDELNKIAIIDDSIPAEFDPDYDLMKHAVTDRLESYEKHKESSFFKVAYHLEEIVGFHFVTKTNGLIAMIATLWVHPDVRHLGIGKHLKELGVEWARQCGCKYIQTGSHIKNERMLDINIKNGFKPFASVLRLKL